MALLRTNQPAVAFYGKDNLIAYVKSVGDDGTITETLHRKHAMQATWRNLRDIRRIRPDVRFTSDLDPNA